MVLGSVFPQRGKEFKYYLMCITIRQEFHEIILYEFNQTVLKINAIVEVFSAVCKTITACLTESDRRQYMRTFFACSNSITVCFR